MAQQWKKNELNRGVLFNNQDRKKNEKWPDYNGRVNVNGEDYFISGWIKTAQKTGVKYLALSFKAVESCRAAGNGAAARDDDTDGLAF